MIFSTNISIQVNHLNYGNHLGHDALLSVLQEARLRWLKTIDPLSSEINIANDVGLLVKEVNLSYHSPGHHGDILDITFHLEKLKRTAFSLHHEVFNQTTDFLLGNGTIVFVCFDYKAKGIAAIPPKLIEALNPH